MPTRRTISSWQSPGERITRIHHVVTGNGRPSVVFVHGFACSHTDWSAQVAQLSSRFQTVAVDLRGHGSTPGVADECSIEQFGADVANLLRARALGPAVLVGHSMGCRVVAEAALQVPGQVAGLVLVDGSQFHSAMAAPLQAACATQDAYTELVRRWFRDMFLGTTDPAITAAALARAESLPHEIGARLVLDVLRYDVVRLEASLAAIRAPVMAIQSTYSDERRQRRPLIQGQTTPYLDMLRRRIPAIRIEVIENTGHFPQLEQSTRTTTLIGDFLTSLSGT